MNQALFKDFKQLLPALMEKVNDFAEVFALS